MSLNKHKIELIKLKKEKNQKKKIKNMYKIGEESETPQVQTQRKSS